MSLKDELRLQARREFGPGPVMVPPPADLWQGMRGSHFRLNAAEIEHRLLVVLVENLIDKVEELQNRITQLEEGKH